MRFSPILRIDALKRHATAFSFMVLLVFAGISKTYKLSAQPENEEINRFMACLPAPPPPPDLNVPTLCDTYGEVDETNADVVIGENVNSVTYSSTVKDPNGPIGVLSWYNQTLVIHGTLIVDDETWFSSCVIRMMPGSRIQVKTPSFLAILSKFFACDQMWQGIYFNQFSGGSIWACHIEDANLAVGIPRNVPLNLVENRFNRNQVGMATLGGGSPVFSPISLGYFWGNTFTLTSGLNAYYSGQISIYSKIVGVMIRSASIDLTSTLANSPNRFVNLDYGIHSAFGFFFVGNAEFIGQTHEGIWAKRGTLHIVESAPCLFRDNFYSGITASSLWEFEVSGSTFDVDGEQYHGIMLEGGGLIQNNTFNLNGSHLYGIRAVRYSNDLDILNNDIDITTLGDGIRVDNIMGNAQGVCNISHNNLLIDVDGSGFNIGIHVVGETGDNFRIEDNDLDIRSPESNEDIIGILFEQGSGVGHVVSQNRVYSSDDEKGAYKAIYIKNVQNGVYCLNETDDTYEGMVFYGNNNPSRIEQNFMYFHNTSLIVDGNPGMAPAVVGPQFRTANYWEPTGYKLFAAVNTGNQFWSNFFIHNPSIVYDPPPLFVDPPGWFIDDYGTAEIECELPMASTNPLDDAVADGSFFDSTSTPLLEWEMNRYLFYKILRDPNYGQGNSDYAAFFTSQQSTTSGAFAQVNRALYSAGALPLGLAAEWEAYGAKCDSLHELIQQLSASATPPTAADDDVSAYINAKTLLLDSMNAYSQAMATAWEIHETNVTGALQSVRALNNGISPVYVFETNQKALNELKIKAALGESWTNGDLTILQTIANQSSDSAGTTVWQGIAMLPRCYEASRSVERVQESTIPSLKNVLNGIRVFPNPTSDIVKLEFPQPFTGTWTFCDAFGKIVAKQEVDQSQLVLFDVSRFAGGIYFLHVSTKDGLNFSQTVVVTH